MSEEAVRKAREWREISPSAEAAAFTEMYQDGHWIRSDRVDSLLAAYRRDSLLEELEGLAKEMCVNCHAGIPVEFSSIGNLPKGWRHWDCSHTVSAICEAAPIRRRLEQLKEEAGND